MKVSKRSEAERIASLTSQEAAKALKDLLEFKGKDYVQDVLMILQDYNTNQWWSDMMFDAGKKIENLY